MIQIQVISKIIESQDFSFIEDNLLDDTYFEDYKQEFNYIKDFYDKYKKVPDKLTFLEKFPDFELVQVNENDKYLLNRLQEEQVYHKILPSLQKVSDLLEQGNTLDAVDYLNTQIKNLPTSNQVGGVDIIKNSRERYENFKDRRENQSKWYFNTGFPELDTIIHGIQRTEELMIIFARVNQGKSWVLEKMCVSVWEQGFNVGYISPEMTANSIGYRFDTLYKNFSNKDLMWGNNLDNDKEYQNYLNALSTNENKLLVATPLDFNNKITISKLRNWVKKNNLNLLAIDGLTYLSDERGKFRDNKTTTLTNISEDLMSLSIELSIPIIAVVQANRAGVAEENDKGTPELETIRDSDGMAMNASKVLSIRQRDGILEIGIKKQRNGAVGAKISYLWDIDKGLFTWVPGEDDSISTEIKEEKIQENKDLFSGDKESVF